MAAPNVCSKTMNISAFISVVAGLGLFIIGIKGIAGNMGQLAGRSVRDWLARSTNSYLSSAAVGMLTGALTQSTNAVTVILMSLYKADLITVPQARPVLVWANVGTMALVFAAAVDTHLFVLLIICVAGLCFYLDLDRSARWRPTVSALFSFALLFLGLELMRQGSHDIRSSEWVGQFLAYSAQWMLLGFVVGIVLALATQSSATVTVIAMAMASAGLMTLQGAMMTLYGASVGSGVSTYLIATSMRGKARQLAILQVMVKALGIAVLLPLFVIEHYFGQPLLAHAITAATADPSLQIAIVYAVIQFVSVLAQEALNRPLWPLIVLLSPASAEDALSTPKYLYAQAREDPETALTLIDREQARVFSLLPLYIGKADAWSESEPVPPRSAILPGAKSLLAALDRFLGELSDTGASRDVLELCANRQARNLMIGAVHEAMDELSVALSAAFGADELRALCSNLTEGIGALLLTAEEANRSLDPGDLAMFRDLTADRDSLVDAMRRRVIASERALSAADQQMLYGITSLFERIIWLLRRYSTLLTPRAEPAPEPALSYGAESRATAAS
jgi:phosphate:Na+ symporter